MYKVFVKRCLDMLLSLMALIVLSPLLCVLAILVKTKLGSPVLFKQERPGMINKRTGKERIFTLYKFRTMSNAKDKEGRLLPDFERLTSFGRFLRSTSLDELPELFNIFLGDMSIIGPRPLAVQYLPYYTNEERKRHSVLPGLTGYAQINGRNHTTWEERFANDLYYVQHVGFVLDVKILFQTVAKVLRKSDIGERGVDSLPDFDVYRKKQANKK